MRRNGTSRIWLGLVAAAPLWINSAYASGDAVPVIDQPTPRQIVIKLKANSAGSIRAKALRTGVRRGPKQSHRTKTIDAVQVDEQLFEILNRYGRPQMNPLHDIDPAHAAIASKHGLDRTYVIKLPDGADLDALIDELTSLGDLVESAEIDVWGEIAQLIPDDPGFCEQWGMNHSGFNCAGQPFGVADSDVDAPEAWDIHTGNFGTVTIAIIDTGVDPHPEYASRMVPGWNIAQNNADTSDGCRHGTHVAGIAAAEGNNGDGVAGMSWGANIMPVRVFAGFGGCVGEASTVAEGIRWAVDNGADICNISLQFCGGTTVLKSAVNYAHDNGVLVVSASGNFDCNDTDPGRPVTFPAAYANSMAVGATDFSDILTNFSAYGPQLDLVAPGWLILSTWSNDVCVGGTSPGAACQPGAQECPGVCVGGLDDGEVCTGAFQCAGTCFGGSNDGTICFSDTFCLGGGTCDLAICTNGECTGLESTYFHHSGTSMATPHVSGLAALMMSYNPALTHTEIREILTLTADDKGTPGWDQFYGYGRLNAHTAMIAAESLPRIFSSDIPDGSIDARQPRDAKDTLDQGWTWVDLKFIGDTSGLTWESFSVSQDGGAGTPPSPLFVSDSPIAGYTRVILDGPINPGAWTTLTHDDSGTSVRLGFLPGDSNEDGVVELADMQTLLNALNDVGATPPIWSIDMDRSGQLTPADILRQIDLLQGSAPYDIYLGTSLP